MSEGAKDTSARRQLAERDFARFVDLMELDLEYPEMDAEDRKSVSLNKHRILTAIVQERMEINDSGEPVYSPTTGGDSFTFHEPQGADLMSMDQRTKSKDVAKLYGVMAAMTRRSVKEFSKLPQRDLKVCLAVVTLFLG